MRVCPECGEKYVECAATLTINWDVNDDGPVERNIDGREGEVLEDAPAWCVNSECMWSGSYTDLIVKEEDNG